MTALPTTTDCYQRRIAELQRQLRALLEQGRVGPRTPAFSGLLEQRRQVLYAAIWAMHAETVVSSG
jgi:hypothetical protein